MQRVASRSPRPTATGSGAAPRVSATKAPSSAPTKRKPSVGKGAPKPAADKAGAGQGSTTSRPAPLQLSKDLLPATSGFDAPDPMGSPQSVSSSVLYTPTKRQSRPSGHIRVCVRVRPVNAQELEKGYSAIIASAEEGKAVQVGCLAGHASCCNAHKMIWCRHRGSAVPGHGVCQQRSRCVGSEWRVTGLFHSLAPLRCFPVPPEHR